jgi:hypothetical protein
VKQDINLNVTGVAVGPDDVLIVIAPTADEDTCKALTKQLGRLLGSPRFLVLGGDAHALVAKGKAEPDRIEPAGPALQALGFDTVRTKGTAEPEPVKACFCHPLAERPYAGCPQHGEYG